MNDETAISQWLNPAQLEWLHRQLGQVTVVADRSWPGTTSTVLQIVSSSGEDLILKTAAPPMTMHITREIAAHRSITRALSDSGNAQQMVVHSEDLGVLVLKYLPGELVQDSPHEFSPETHFQAGKLLFQLHQQGARRDENYQELLIESGSQWLNRPHRVPEEEARIIRTIFTQTRPVPVTVVPTHGDWHPRNWLVETGDGLPRIRAIDFGRFAWRTPQSDFVRLELAQWLAHPELSAAFLEGYGTDPRDDSYNLEQLVQVVSSACWAHMMGDDPFEQQSLEQITRILGTIPRL